MNQPNLPDMGGESQPPPETMALRQRRDFVPVACAACDREMDYDEFHNTANVGEEGTPYEDKTLCETCFSEHGPETTLRVFSAEYPDGDGDYGETIFEVVACRNMTANDGDIGTWRCHRQRIDGWRSYVVVDPPPPWVEFHSDVALSGSADAHELERFDLYLRKALIAKDMRLIRAVSLTTNVFSQGVDYFVKRENLAQAQAVARKLAAALRDPVRFRLTAVTGKDPEDADRVDHLLAVIGAVTLGREEA